jgi:hypothetical protein
MHEFECASVLSPRPAEGKVVSRGEGIGEGVDVTLLSLCCQIHYIQGKHKIFPDVRWGEDHPPMSNNSQFLEILTWSFEVLVLNCRTQYNPPCVELKWISYWWNSEQYICNFPQFSFQVLQNRIRTVDQRKRKHYKSCVPWMTQRMFLFRLGETTLTSKLGLSRNRNVTGRVFFHLFIFLHGGRFITPCDVHPAVPFLIWLLFFFFFGLRPDYPRNIRIPSRVRFSFANRKLGSNESGMSHGTTRVLHVRVVV